MSNLKIEDTKKIFVVEGKDQLKGWFYSLLKISTSLGRKAPYQEVFSHGFVLDEKGKKMSKSLGNVIEPETIINKFGIDLLRLWVSSCDLTRDLRFGFSTLENLRESYQKIRNTFRFLLGNLSILPPELKNEKFLEKELSIIDYYFLNQLENLKIKSEENYEKYQFNLIYSDLLRFCNELSNFYFEVNKDSLYCDKINSFKRKKIITTFYFLLQGLLIIVGPILPFLAEEVYQNIPFNFGYTKEKSSFLIEEFSNNLVPEKEKNKLNLITDFLLPLRKEIYFFLEKERKEKNIESNSQASLKIFFKDKLNYFDYSELILNELLLVAEVKILNKLEKDMKEGEFIFLKIEKTFLNRCLRCWNYRNCENSICFRCKEIIDPNN